MSKEIVLVLEATDALSKCKERHKDVWDGSRVRKSFSVDFSRKKLDEFGD